MLLCSVETKDEENKETRMLNRRSSRPGYSHSEQNEVFIESINFSD